MKKTDLVILFLLGCLVTSGVAYFQRTPGYMDAEYYYAGGISLAKKHGFTDQFLWNYLDDPAGIPHPSHLYWMPLTSIVSAIVPAITNVFSFPMARIPFILLSGFVPVLTALVSWSFSHQRRSSLIAGLLAIFSGFYLAYYGTSDTFVIYMLLGCSFITLGGKILSVPTIMPLWRWILIGTISGLMHLTRADGIIWFILAYGCLVMFWINCKEKQPVAFKQWIAAAGSILLGYLAIMGPWMLRNQLVSGHVLSSSGLKGLWILNYDEIFSYPASQLTFRHWLSGGLQTAIHTRVEALLAVLKTGIGVQGEIFLLPFSLIAMWIHRHDPRIRIGAAAWISILIVMVLVFPFAGSRGGFLHSGTAAQIYLWALAPMGLERVVAWGSGKRGWDPQQANQFFQFGMVIIVVLVTGLITQSLVIGQNLSSPVWNQGWDEVVLIESDLHSLGVNPAAVMMVNNPPGYTVATGRRTIVIPDANIEKILEAAHRYGANYLLIQANHPHGLDDLYLHPRSGLALEFLGTIQSGQIFRIGNE